MDIVTFVNERLDECERIARAALQGEWRFDLGLYEIEAVFGEDVRDVCYVYGRRSDYDIGEGAANGKHIACHDPRSVLRDVAAKREILMVCKNMLHGGDPDAEVLADVTVRAFAALDDDHPDYNPAWTPE